LNVLPHARNAKDRGYILADLLVALALLAILSISIGQFISLSTRTWQVSKETEHILSTSAAHFRLRSWLATPCTPNTTCAFSGQTDEFHLSITPTGAFTRATANLQIRITQIESRTIIEMQNYPSQQFSGILASGVSGARFMYFGLPDARTEGRLWLNTWERSDRMPDLVKISLPDSSVPEFVAEVGVREQ